MLKAKVFCNAFAGYLPNFVKCDWLTMIEDVTPAQEKSASQVDWRGKVAEAAPESPKPNTATAASERLSVGSDLRNKNFQRDFILLGTSPCNVPDAMSW